MKKGFIFNLIFLFLISLSSACNEEKNETIPLLKKPATHVESKMSQNLREFNKQLNPMKSPYKNAQRAELFRTQAMNIRGSAKLSFQMRACYEDLLAGNSRKALEAFKNLEIEVLSYNNALNEPALKLIREYKALCYLRIGEQDNCQNNHSAESCILPLSDKAVHTEKMGSENAIKELTGILEKNPSDENHIYLLNIAYMTLGRYPDSVPKKYLRQLVADEKNLIPKFTNISGKLGLDDFRLSGGVIIDDFNNDYNLDIALSSWSLNDRLKIYYNRGNGVFEENNQESISGINGGLNMIHTDYNNDGYLDIYILRGGWLINGPSNSLLRNNRDESFTDVSYETGLSSAFPTQTAAWADFNLDGYLDLFIGNESSSSGVNECELYISQKGESFINVAKKTGADLKIFSKGVCVADYDNDGDFDIYVSNLTGDNYLMKNLLKESGSLNFKNVAAEAGVQYPHSSFPCWFFDFNNDGWDDIFVSGYSTSNYSRLASEWSKAINGMPFNSDNPKLYLNNKNGTYTDVSDKYGFDTPSFAMGANFGDINNDNYPDIYLATGEPDYKAIIPNRMFLNNNGKSYDEVTTQGGFGHIQKGHAVSFADIDNDGDEDVYCVLGGAYEGDVFFNNLFENPIKSNSWIKLKLIGQQSNRAALGSKVKMICSNGTDKLEFYKTVSNSSSFGENPFMLNFSIPDGYDLTEIEILWPLGHVQTIKGLNTNVLYEITEADDNFTPIEVKSFDASSLENHKHHVH